ncbi:hypothetical protein [Sideroxydans sp. CL21]|nr:hypothetical protein [Sideroxydans sp. CL21]
MLPVAFRLTYDWYVCAKRSVEIENYYRPHQSATDPLRTVKRISMKAHFSAIADGRR